jgi:hypothetical protein
MQSAEWAYESSRLEAELAGVPDAVVLAGPHPGQWRIYRMAAPILCCCDPSYFAPLTFPHTWSSRQSTALTLESSHTSDRGFVPHSLLNPADSPEAHAADGPFDHVTYVPENSLRESRRPRTSTSRVDRPSRVITRASISFGSSHPWAALCCPLSEPLHRLYGTYGYRARRARLPFVRRWVHAPFESMTGPLSPSLRASRLFRSGLKSAGLRLSYDKRFIEVYCFTRAGAPHDRTRILSSFLEE